MQKDIKNSLRNVAIFLGETNSTYRRGQYFRDTVSNDLKYTEIGESTNLGLINWAKYLEGQVRVTLRITD